MTSGRLRPFMRAALPLLLLAAPACRRSTLPDAPPEPAAPEAPAHTAPLLDFPQALHVADPSVNDFIRSAMTTAAAGRYDDFRLLWSAREEPLSREEYHQGWEAVRHVRLRALEKIVIAPDVAPADGPAPDMYAAYVEVTLDPRHRAAREKPQREAILVMVREQDRWTLMRAPKSVRDWLRGQIAGTVDDRPSADAVPQTSSRP